MPSLLDLPVELRLKILEYLHVSTRIPPESYDPTYRAQRQQISSRSPSNSPLEDHSPPFTERVEYEIDHTLYLPNITPLLSVNRQLRLEAGMILHSRPPTRTVDILVVSGQTLWPAWTFVPDHRVAMERLKVTVRFDDAEVALGDLGADEADGCPSRFYRSLWCVLRQVLRRGSISPLQDRDRHLNNHVASDSSSFPPAGWETDGATVKYLEIDIQDDAIHEDDEDDMYAYLDYDSVSDSEDEDQVTYSHEYTLHRFATRDPTILLFLNFWLTALWCARWDLPDWVSFYTLLLTGVGHVGLRRNGKLVMTEDIGEALWCHLPGDARSPSGKEAEMNEVVYEWMEERKKKGLGNGGWDTEVWKRPIERLVAGGGPVLMQRWEEGIQLVRYQG